MAHYELTGLYQSRFERDSCGFGLIAQMDDMPSHWLVETAIHSLARLTHRGAVAADGKTGDGCGLLLKMPDGFLRSTAAQNGITLSSNYGTGLVFLSQDESLARAARERLESLMAKHGLKVAGWRSVPINTEACGSEALDALPRIEQLFINAPASMTAEAFESRLFVARRRAEIALESRDKAFYIPSLSSRVLAYKGLVTPENLAVFYPDLNDPGMTSSIGVFHQRFSTNTLPQWRLAQPFRYLAHNGRLTPSKVTAIGHARGLIPLNLLCYRNYPSCYRWFPWRDPIRAPWIIWWKSYWLEGWTSFVLCAYWSHQRGRTCMRWIQICAHFMSTVRCTWNHGMVPRASY